MENSKWSQWKLATRLVQAGRSHEPGAPLNPSITLSTGFNLGGEYGYSRGDQPNWTATQSALGGGVDLAVAHEFLERLQDPRDGAVAAARQDANLVVLRVPLHVPRPTGRRRRPRRTRLRG